MEWCQAAGGELVSMLTVDQVARFGPVDRVVECAGEHRISRVFRLELECGKRIFLKRLGPRGYQQEKEFFRRFGKRIDGVPDLLQAIDDKHTLLLSEVPGQRLQESRDREVYRAAGRFLRRLHNQPYQDTDEVSLQDALFRRLQTLEKDAGGLLGEEVVGTIVAEFESLRHGAAGLRRVPSHRDFMEHNWLWAEENRLSVVDFEHARPDFWLLDLIKMNSGVWLEFPELKIAFLRGYGRALTEWEESMLRLWSVVWSAGTLLWARSHGDSRYQALGERALGMLIEK